MSLIQPVENGKIKETTLDENTKAANNNLGYDEFLQLLCAEMQYQDPLEPTSNTEYVAQLATFSQMEATLNMQNTLLSNNANSLVGKYVIVKSTSATTGETTATAGYVDYVQYENSKQYLYINGNRYALEDVYQVADTDYVEAVTLAEAFKTAVAKLPGVDDLSLIWQEDVENLCKVYESLTSYQQSMIDSDTMETYKALVQKMNELLNNSSDDGVTDGAEEGDGVENGEDTENKTE